MRLGDHHARASSAAATRPRRAARSSCARARACSCSAVGPPGVEPAATQFGFKPRVRSGYALKRLDASPRARSAACCSDLNRGQFLRLSDRDAELFQLLDGSHSLCRDHRARRAALRRRRRGRGRAPARRPRLARLPGRRRRARTRTRSTRRRASCGGSSGRARSRSRASAALRGALRARRLAAVHAAGADLPGGADRGRRRRVHLPGRRPLRDAVRGRPEDRPRRRDLPGRPLRVRRRPRDRPRARRWRATAARSTGPG